jgi:glyoxylase-like metal-dependent hydrolase (beta-lactamase superfamily II)
LGHTNEVQLIANEGWDERILVCRNGELVDTFIIVTARYVALVDTMINAATAASLLAHAQPHLTNGRTLLVVNTHADYDHCWGNQLFVGPGAKYPAPIIGRRASLAVFDDPEVVAYQEKLQREEPDIFGDLVVVPPTILYGERLLIDGGDLTLELLATPGHTADHAALYIPQINTLLAADAAELPFPFARTADGLPHMRASLAQLAALNAATVLYCHAPPTVGPQLLRDNITYFDRLEARCRAALAQGMPATPDEDADVAALIGLPYEAVVPAGGPWQNVHNFYRTQGHAMQIRAMLAWLAHEGA